MDILDLMQDLAEERIYGPRKQRRGTAVPDPPAAIQAAVQELRKSQMKITWESVATEISRATGVLITKRTVQRWATQYRLPHPSESATDRRRG
jgi:hypothetical protein